MDYETGVRLDAIIQRLDALISVFSEASSSDKQPRKKDS